MKMKKIISLLLVIMIVLFISACGGNETATDNDNGSSTTQNQTDVTDTSSTEQSTDTTSSDIDNNGNTDDTDVSSSTASKPNTAEPDASKPTTTEPESTKPSTPTHTHSYSGATCTSPEKCSCGATNGSALGHNYNSATCTEAKKCSRCGVTEGNALGHEWQDATCQAPKTCSVCKITTGNKSEHIYVGVRCKFCNNPLEKISTLSWGIVEDNVEYGYRYRYTILDFKNNILTNALGIKKENVTENDYVLYEFKLNNVEYVITGCVVMSFGDFDIKKYIEFEDDENITIYPYLYEYSDTEYIKLKRLNQTELVVVENTTFEWYNFKVGKILKLVNISIN